MLTLKQARCGLVFGSGQIYTLTNTMLRETQDQLTNPGFTYGSSPALGRLSLKLSVHTCALTLKVCHALFAVT